MRSSTSSSDVRFFAALALTFLVLAGSWEAVLRKRAGATADFQFAAPAPAPNAARAEETVIFGNCLMMTGVSPRRVSDDLGADGKNVIVNIAAHEQSPIAFFEYLRRSEHYPDVVVTNVSSWLNGTNFDQESELVTKNDPLHLRRAAAAPGAPAPEQAFQKDGQSDGQGGGGQAQRRAEEALGKWAGSRFKTLDHRYHLFDYALFVGALGASGGDLDAALYQLNMQSWFRVARTEPDGRGYIGIDVDYREDWDRGLERMAERSLQRLRLSRLLTPDYWQRLEDEVRHFQSHGTQVLLVRMPEHPKIRAFNDETYEIPARLRGLEERTGAPTLDLSQLGPADGVHLFDAVHPDARAADVISARVASWLRTRRMVRASP